MRLLAALLALSPLFAQSPEQKIAREIFKQLIEINTTDSVGDNTRAAEAMAARFRAAGFAASDVTVLGPARKGNLVVRFHGAGPARPLLFIGHLDVVEARRADWPADPFQFREQDGYFYGRGASDMKDGDATLVAAFLRLKRENYRPSRDLILALTSDEEGGPANGIDWLVTKHRELIDAEYCINLDAGGGHIKNGKHLFMAMQAAEKVFLSFKLEATNNGGHSSLPTKDNAIYHLSDGLSRLGKFDFPVHLFDVTRTAFERGANIYGGQLGADLKMMVQNPNDPAPWRAFPPSQSITLSCAPPAWPPCYPAATPRMRCRNSPLPRSTAACSPWISPPRSAPRSNGFSPTPRSSSPKSKRP